MAKVLTGMSAASVRSEAGCGNYVGGNTGRLYWYNVGFASYRGYSGKAQHLGGMGSLLPLGRLQHAAAKAEPSTSRTALSRHWPPILDAAIAARKADTRDCKISNESGITVGVYLDPKIPKLRLLHVIDDTLPNQAGSRNTEVP